MKEVRVLELDKYEYGIIVNALNEFRNNLIKEERESCRKNATKMQNIEGKKNKNGEKTKFLGEKFGHVRKKL